MEIDEVKQVLRGPMIPVITNLQNDLSVDHGAIRENVGYVVERGIRRGRGVLLAGGAGGDFPMLSLEERKQVAKTIVESAADTPVLVGAQDTNLETCIAMARFAEEVGAYGIQLSPPYYFSPSDDDCLRWFDAVHEATHSAAIMVYNTYWEGYCMSLDVVTRLARLPRVVALKWSHPEIGIYQRGVIRLANRLAVVDNQGVAGLTHMLGGTGFITHLCTIWPEHDLEVWDLLEAGDYLSAQRKTCEANWPWLDFRGKMWERTGGESPVIKAGLELCGRPGGPCRPPARSLTKDESLELYDVFRWIGVPNLPPEPS
jgi:dihydrodipicolinate synthase/N-acetylneuraminate lyase